MAPKRGKGKKKPAKKTATEAETRTESAPVSPSPPEDPPEGREEEETRVEDPKGAGGDIPMNPKGGGGDGPSGDEEEDGDSFHDARESEEEEEEEGNEKKEKGREENSGEEKKSEEEEEEQGSKEKGKGIEGGEEEQSKETGEKAKDREEKGSEEDQSKEKANETEARDDGSEELSEAMQPLKLYFEKSEYVKPTKIITRCYNYKAVENLESILDPEELRWFKEHPQFCHFFHMPKETNHRSMGMWLLLLRTASIEKKNEAWFVVNGVPVRYSMREHALLSGLNCKEYPSNYQEFGNLDFVKKHFKSEKVSYEEIRDKFLSMTSQSSSRLQMAVLYFLTSVILGVAKQGEGAPSVDSKLLKYVSNLEWCRNFPWGRLTFLDCIKEIQHTMDSCQGVAKSIWCFPSFIILLELLAFEAIPKLKSKFREEVREASGACPRMCKSKFKLSSNKGFTIGELNYELGETKDIWSIMEPNLEELPLIMQNTEVDSFDSCDPVVDGWMRLLANGKKIWFEELFKNDVDGRKETYIKEEKGKGKRKCKGKEKEKEKEKENKGDVGSSDEIKHLMEAMEAGFKTLGEMFAGLDQSVNTTISSLHGRLHSINGRLARVEEVLELPNAEEAEARRKQEEEEASRLAKEEALRKQKEEASRLAKEEALRKQEEEAKRQAEQSSDEEESGGSNEEGKDKGKTSRKRTEFSSYKKPVTRGSKRPKKAE